MLTRTVPTIPDGVTGYETDELQPALDDEELFVVEGSFLADKPPPPAAE